MNADQDSVDLLNSDDEFLPSPPKRGRAGRGRGRGRANRRGRGSVRARARGASCQINEPVQASQQRSSLSRSRRSRNNVARVPSVPGSHNTRYGFIPVGDISDDELPDSSDENDSVQIGPDSSLPKVAQEPIISLDALAKILGVDDDLDTSDLCVVQPDSHMNTPISQSSNDLRIVIPDSNAATPISQSSNDSGNSVTAESHLISMANDQILEKSTHGKEYKNRGLIINNSVSTTDPIDTSSKPPTSCVSNSVINSDGNASNTDKPAAPKKTIRRGLAKKCAGLTAPTLDEPVAMSSQKSTVYSQCVPSGGLSSLFDRSSHVVADGFVRPSDSAVGETSTKRYSERLEGMEVDGVETKSTEKNRLTKACAIPEPVEDDSVMSLDVSYELRSPSPPPEHTEQKKGRSRGKKMTKKLSNALQALNNVRGKLNASTPPMFRKRGRGRKDVVIVGEEEGVEKNDILVKVRYISTVHRISLNLDEPLYTLTERLSNIVGDVEQHCLTLFFKDEQLQLSDTPRSINLSVADIIECYNFKTCSGDESGDCEDSINIVVQCQHSRTKKTVSVMKLRPLHDLIQKYALENDLNPSTLSLFFDGESVDPRSTPFKLEMEDMDVVDVSVR